jgi:hypothetical protein
MNRTIRVFFCVLAITIGAPAVHGQQNDEAARIRNRELLAQLLDRVGPEVHVTFTQSQKNPFNYSGLLRQGLVNVENFEIVFSVTDRELISLRVFPYYKGNYINLDKVRDRDSLMRQLLRLSDRAFLFWGADASGDVFTGYSFTLESGFPDEAIRMVLRSIVNSDQFVGELRPAIDGTTVR